MLKWDPNITISIPVFQLRVQEMQNSVFLIPSRTKLTSVCTYIYVARRRSILYLPMCVPTYVPSLLEAVVVVMPTEFSSEAAVSRRAERSSSGAREPYTPRASAVLSCSLLKPLFCTHTHTRTRTRTYTTYCIMDHLLLLLNYDIIGGGGGGDIHYNLFIIAHAERTQRHSFYHSRSYFQI